MCPSARRSVPEVSDSLVLRMIRSGLVMKSMTVGNRDTIVTEHDRTGIESAPDGSPMVSLGCEVNAALDRRRRITAECARQLCDSLDANGFVMVPLALSEGEADTGRGLIEATLADPGRSQAAFASQTDNHYRRRDFCSLPSTPEVIAFASLICQRLRPVLEEYCGHSRAILEVTTLTSYRGCSHQYFHHDPYGAISILVAVEDLSPEQGSTVFVPATHRYGGARMRHGGKAFELTELFRIRSNLGVLLHNLKKLWSMRIQGRPELRPGEFLARVFSRRQDDHQPNLLRFVLGKTYQFKLTMLNPLNLWRMFKYRRELREFTVIPTSPQKGTVILLTRQVCRSHSGLQAGPESRRRSQRMVIPLARARTQSRALLEAPNILNFNDRPQCGFRQTALSKLAVGVLQRRFAALLPKATLRLNAIYIPAGLIYRSDILHAGADNCSTRPRHLFSLSIARDRVDPAQWQRGYAPHASLLARPLSFGELVNGNPPFSAALESRA
jgi:hypothetical protein